MDIWVASNFQLLWIMLLRNTGVQICLWTLLSIIWDIHPTWHDWIMWKMYFSFLRKHHTASIAAAPFYIPTHSAECSAVTFEQEQNSPEKYMTCSRAERWGQDPNHSFLTLRCLPSTIMLNSDLRVTWTEAPALNSCSLSQPGPAEQCNGETFYVPKDRKRSLLFLIQNED